MAASTKMTKTYYIIKASNTTLEHTYLVLQMKEHYETKEEAQAILDKADPDIIPKGSGVYRVEEHSTDFTWPTVTITIKMTPA